MPTEFENYVNTELPKRLAIAVAVLNNYVRFTGTGKQVEARTPAQVLADIGALDEALHLAIGDSSPHHSNSNDVTAAAVLADTALVRGSGGARGVQDSLVLCDAAGNVTGIALLTADSYTTTPTNTSKFTGIYHGDTPVLAPFIILSRARDGTPTYIVAAGDYLGGFLWSGGATEVPAYGLGAGLYAVAAEAWGAANYGTKLEFWVCPNGSPTVAVKMRLDQDGKLYALGGLDVTGDIVVSGNVDGVDVSAHTARHKHGGPDEVAVATPGANAIPKAGAGSELDRLWLPNMVGDSGAGGSKGAVPAPDAGDAAAGKFLKASGAWVVPPSGGSPPTGTGFRHITGGVEDAAAKLVDTVDINADQVTYPKMQNVSATDRVLGRATGGAGDVEEIACTAAGRALIDDADAAAQRTTLGLGAIALEASPLQISKGGTGVTTQQFSVHQYAFGNDEADGADVTTGAISRYLSTGDSVEACTRITVHALTTPASGNLVFNIEESSAEDLNGATWSNKKTVTFTATGADPDSHIDGAPAFSFTARRSIRINITSAPVGWKDVSILLEVKRALTT